MKQDPPPPLPAAYPAQGRECGDDQVKTIKLSYSCRDAAAEGRISIVISQWEFRAGFSASQPTDGDGEGYIVNDVVVACPAPNQQHSCLLIVTNDAGDTDEATV